MRIVVVSPVDRLDRDDRTLLLYPGNLVSLGPLGTAVVDLAGEPIGLDELLPAMLELLGAPDHGDAGELVREAVDQLIEAGVLNTVAVDGP